MKRTQTKVAALMCREQTACSFWPLFFCKTIYTLFSIKEQFQIWKGSGFFKKPQKQQEVEINKIIIYTIWAL